MQAVPSDWDNNAHTIWLADQKLDAVQSVFTKINASGPNKPKGLMVQAGFYLYFLKDYSACVGVLSHALALFPNDKDIVPTLVVALSRNRQYDQAKTYAEAYVALYPDNYSVWDSLANIYHKLDLNSEAVVAGTNSLRIKDKAAEPWANNWLLPTESPQAFCKDKKNVISYSLWGNHPRYLNGALRNVLLAPDIYPDWELWFYVDSSVPKRFINLIKRLGAKVIHEADSSTVKEKLCWRFQVCNAEGVGYFLVRDADSVISIRERSAVEAWLQSGQWFHVIRDWWTHTDLILAGLWGGVAGVLPNVSTLLHGYAASAVETPNIDQWFLRDCIWAYVKTSCLEHDRYFKHRNALPLPGYSPVDNFHVGCCEYTQKKAFQAAVLAPWLDQLNET